MKQERRDKRNQMRLLIFSVKTVFREFYKLLREDYISRFGEDKFIQGLSRGVRCYHS